MTSPAGGHWVTIHGHHIFLKGAHLAPQHVADVAAQAGLSSGATAALQSAHASGQLKTDTQLHGAAAQISGAVAVGFDENHATSEAISHFAKSGADSSGGFSASGKTTVTSIYQAGKGKTKGGHVGVVTHGAAVSPGEASAYAANFGLDKQAAIALDAGAKSGLIKDDTHLAQMVGDAIHVAKMTGVSHSSALSGLMSGNSATSLIAAHSLNAAKEAGQAAAATLKSQAAAASSIAATDKVPITTVGLKNKADFAAIPDVELPGETAVPKLKPGQTQSAGILLVEPDGKIWVYEPKGHFAGYEHTFSKGGVEKGLTLQQSAHKELYEELGLTAKITGVVGDFSTSGTSTRYYIGVRTGGDPKDAELGKTQSGAGETEAVKLVTPDEAAKLLNKPRDKDVLKALQAHLTTNGNPHQAESKEKPVVAPATVSVPPVDVTPHNLVAKAGVADFLAESGVSGGLTDNGWAALSHDILSAAVKQTDLPAILGVAATMAKDEGKAEVNTGHIKKSIWMHKKGVIDPNHKSKAAASAPTTSAPSWSSDAAELKLKTEESGAWNPAEVAQVADAAENLAAQDGKTEVSLDHWMSAVSNHFPAAAAEEAAAEPFAVTAASVPPPSPSHHVTIQGKKFDVDHSKPVTPSDVDELKSGSSEEREII